MKQWSVEQANEWYKKQPWLVGCNYLPGNAVNQLEMWQAETYDPQRIDLELGWAESLGFNALRVYLHDLCWRDDETGFCSRIDDFLGIAERHGMKVLLVLFDDCHRPDPVSGVQLLPVACVHNCGWAQSPGAAIRMQFHEGTVAESEKVRLQKYIQGVLKRFSGDERILMWDIYNEAGQFGPGDTSNELLTLTWQWAQEVRPSQPLTACLDGAVGEKNTAINLAKSDVTTFHCYGGKDIEASIVRHKAVAGRPTICTEYMAREAGTTFQHSLPLFKKYQTGCFNWGLVAGKSQTHFNWKTMATLEDRKAQGLFLKPGDPIPEPELWFHDIFRMDGTPFDQKEVDFIRAITRE
jgi:hypothetical protein